MKKTSLTCIILFLSLFYLAQEPQARKKPADFNTKNEIGLSLFSCAIIQENSQPYSLTDHALSEIYYKRHFGQTALRFSFDNGQSNLNQVFPHYTKRFDRLITTEQLNVGYQFKFGHWRLSPFFYADAFFRSSGELQRLPGNFLFNDPTNKIGWTTGGGLRYPLTLRLALTYEFSVCFAPDYLAVNPVRMLGFSYGWK